MCCPRRDGRWKSDERTQTKRSAISSLACWSTRNFSSWGSRVSTHGPSSGLTVPDARIEGAIPFSYDTSSSALHRVASCPTLPCALSTACAASNSVNIWIRGHCIQCKYIVLLLSFSKLTIFLVRVSSIAKENRKLPSGSSIDAKVFSIKLTL